MVYTREEKYQIMVWHHNGISERQIQNLFADMFPNRPRPSRGTIQNIMHNIITYGCLSPTQHKTVQPPRPINPDRELRDILICASVEQNSEQSTRQLGEEFGLSSTMISRILRKHGYRCYKLKRGNEQFPNDQYRRMEFCETVMEMSNRDENLIANILFTDESTFPVHGRHNPMNVRYWSRENTRRFYAARSQNPRKLNVWAGILGDHIVGPFFIDGMLTGQKYLDLLQNQIVPAVRGLPVPFETVWFQQDGCPAHNSRQVRAYLEEVFPGRLISGYGNILWPARSPDLAPCDFFLWGYIKSKLYGFQEQRANNLDELREQILNSVGDISPDMLSNVRAGFINRLGYCSAEAGGLFEHLL